MKRVCFVELEGILTNLRGYAANEVKVKEFLKSLHSFCKENNIETFLVSGHHESIAKQKVMEKEFHKFFDKDHFAFVDDIYIESKVEEDKKQNSQAVEFGIGEYSIR